MSVHVSVTELIWSFFGATETPRERPELTNEQHLVLECYLSGQIPEAAWDEHVREEPVLAQYVNQHGNQSAPALH